MGLRRTNGAERLWASCCLAALLGAFPPKLRRPLPPDSGSCCGVGTLPLVEVGTTAFAAPARASSYVPSSDELLQALGRELWVAADELLAVAARSRAGPALGQFGILFRNSADLMCDGDWENVMGELESASVCCMDILPYERFEGLINLFSYYEPMPAIEWQAACNSLMGLSMALKDREDELLRGLEGPYMDRTARSLQVVIQRLQKAARLFEAGGFYMPADPRDEMTRRGRGKIREPDLETRSPGPTEGQDVARKQFLTQQLQGQARSAAQAAGSGAVAVLDRVDGQLRAAASEKEKNKLLRKLVRELHPDQNPGKVDEVLPTFTYVKELRAVE